MMLSTLRHNPMVYKDLTQWLRRRSFAPMFFGLLGFAEFLTLWVVMFPDDMVGEAGPFLFGFLMGVLIIYAYITAITGYGLTRQEHRERTFELFLLSGVSLEKMIWGKLWSLMSRFFFGFFCIVPFIFFAYMQGGLDYRIVLGASLWLTIAVVPMFLLSLNAGLLKSSRMATFLFWLLIVCYTLYTLQAIFPYWRLMFYRPSYGMSSAYPSGMSLFPLLTFSGVTAINIILFLLKIILYSLLFFYTACNQIAPSTDSRQTPLKVIVFLFSVLTLGSCYYFSLNYLKTMTTAAAAASSSGAAYSYSFLDQPWILEMLLPVFALVCLVGMGCLFGPAVAPLAVRTRMAQAGRLRRAMHFCFKPDSKGTLRTVLLIWYGIILFTVLLNAVFSSASDTASLYLFVIMSLLIQSPWFVVFPAIIRLRSKRFREGGEDMRKWIFWAWVWGAVLMIVLAAVGSNWLRDASFLAIPALVISPFSSAIMTYIEASENRFDINLTTPLIRAGLGVVGVIIMTSVARSRFKKAAYIPVKPMRKEETQNTALESAAFLSET